MQDKTYKVVLYQKSEKEKVVIMGTKKMMKDLVNITVGSTVMGQAATLMPAPYGGLTSTMVGVGVLGSVAGKQKKHRRLKWQ